VAGLSQGEPRLPALNQETVGERRGVTGADLGVQHLQFARVRRGPRSAEQLERHAGLRHGRLSP
jgi:hypothetical protein